MVVNQLLINLSVTNAILLTINYVYVSILIVIDGYCFINFLGGWENF